MSKMVLCVEDDPSLIDAFNNSISDLKDSGIDINGVAVKTRDEALEFVGDNNLIGVIVDLNLGDDGVTSGVIFIEELAKNFNKIPIAIYSGTVADLNAANDKILSSLCIKIYIKDDTSYDEIIQRFIKISNTGISKVLGDKGIIEKILFDIFQRKILPDIDSWIEYKNEQDLIEPFTRHAINYMRHIIDEMHEDYLSIEFYLKPEIIGSNENIIKTGEIYTDNSQQHYFVITPACDLANNKTDYIQLIPIIQKSDYINTQKGFIVENTKYDLAIDLTACTGQQKNSLKNCFENKNPNMHYFPNVSGVFEGGFINFRNIQSIKIEHLREYKKKLQVSSDFVKDIVARFSAYYARQGQPELIDKKI